MSDEAEDRQAQRKFQAPIDADATPDADAGADVDAGRDTGAGADGRPAQVKAIQASVSSALPPVRPVVVPPPVVPPVAPPRVVVPPPPAQPVAAVVSGELDSDPSPVDSAEADADFDDADFDDADFDDVEPRRTFAERLRRISPALVMLSILSLGSLAFLAFAMTSHTTPVPVLLSSAVVTGLAFTVDAVVSSYMTYRAGKNGDAGKALALAVVGGIAAVIAAGAFAGTLILVLLIKS